MSNLPPGSSGTSLDSESAPSSRVGPFAHVATATSPVYLFRVGSLVFEPFEALAKLALALLTDPLRVTRLRFVAEGEVARRRSDILSAIFARGASHGAGAEQDTNGPEWSFAPVALAATPNLVAMVERTFAWMGLRPNEAPAELNLLRLAVASDDDERAMRGELSVLATRATDVSHLVLFDDGARELLKISAPLSETPKTRRKRFDSDVERRLEGLLRSRP